jgi:predicted nuclease of predicted toxin-antitoxin system
MRVIVDMNLSPRWIGVLATGSVLAAHRSALGPVGASDATIMEHALAKGAVVLTHDLDFGSILAATGARGPSVIQLRGEAILPELAGGAVIDALDQFASELAAGALLTLDARRARVSLLPLRR